MERQVIKYVIDVDQRGGVQKFGKLSAAGVGAGSKIGAAFMAAGPYIAAAAAAATALSIGVKKVMDVYLPFEKELANVSTLVDTSVVNMSEMRDEILKLPSALGSATDLTKGLYQAISAGIPAENGVSFIAEAAKAAKAGLTDTNTAVDGLTTALNAYGMASSQVTTISDQMFTAVKAGKTTFGELASSIGKVAPIANTVGVSSKELLASIAALTTQGLKTSEAVTSLKAAFSNILKPSSQAKEAAEELGIKFDFAALKSQGLAKFLQEVGTAVGDDSAKMTELFGSTEAANAIFALTSEQGGAKLIDTLNSMAKSAGETQTAFDKQTATLGASLDRISVSFEKIGIIIGSKIAPPLANVTEGFANFIEEMMNAENSSFSDVLTLMEEGFKAIKGVLDLLSPILKAFIGYLKFWVKYMTLIVKGINEFLAIVNAFKDGIAGILTPLKDFVTGSKDADEAVKSMGKSVDETSGFFKDKFKSSIESAGSAVDSITSKYKGFMDAVKDRSGQIMVKFKGEGSTVKPLGEKIDEMSGKLNGFTQDVDTDTPVKFDFQDAAGDSLTTALDATERGFGNMFDSVLEGTANVKDGFGDMITGILASVGKMLASQAIKSFVGMLGTSIGGIFEGGFSIPGFADGGNIRNGGKPVLVGERGPELFVPRGSGTVVPNHELGGGGGNFSVVNNINVDGGGTGNQEDDRRLSNDIARAIDEKIRMQIANQMRPGGLLNQTQRLGAMR